MPGTERRTEGQPSSITMEEMNYVFGVSTRRRDADRLSPPLQAPSDLAEAIKSRDLHIVQCFLTKNFESATKTDFAWLRELDESGYSMREMAELLLEDIQDSPWICFTPRAHEKRPVHTEFHIPDCVHRKSFNATPPSVIHSDQISSYFLPLHNDIRRLVEELCGIGGVVPSSKDLTAWYGSIIFTEQSSCSVVTYAARSVALQQSRNELLIRISNVLANFCTAAAAVQSTGLCCNAFTVLLRKQNYLELRRIEFADAATMLININLAIKDNIPEEAVKESVRSALRILQELRLPLAETIPDVDLHYCALAAQFLCLAFLSYVQAHIGLIDPFFLDKPQQTISLLGNQSAPGDFAISAELVELTCLAVMTNQPVLAFSLGAINRDSSLGDRSSRYDILTSVEDFLDTWGPGYFVCNKTHPSHIHAIIIGGGFVSLIDVENSLFHWTRGSLTNGALGAAFEMNTLLRIGTGVSDNKECCVNEVVYRESSFSCLEPLDTYEVLWEMQERQAGFQAGQYLVCNYNQNWNEFLELP